MKVLYSFYFQINYYYKRLNIILQFIKQSISKSCTRIHLQKSQKVKLKAIYYNKLPANKVINQLLGLYYFIS